jgi:tryptophan 2,3-dioxygenase
LKRDELPRASEARPSGSGVNDEVPEGMHTDLAGTLTYGVHLQLERLLSAQKPVSDSDHEPLFIIIHQTSELWMKLLLHELGVARALLEADAVSEANRRLARCACVLSHMVHSWDVLATLTPNDFLTFRGRLETGSGLQSYQYRLIEFALGAKNRAMLLPHRHTPEIHARLEAAIEEPGLYDAAIGLLARRGLLSSTPRSASDGPQSDPPDPAVAEAWLAVYRAPDEHPDVYALAERLVDLEYRFSQWRVHHLKTVERVIGYKRGTGGTSGVPYLRGVLDRLFFPELWEIRTRL